MINMESHALISFLEKQQNLIISTNYSKRPLTLCILMDFPIHKYGTFHCVL